MIELALVVCLAAEPAKCKDVGLVYDGEALTPMQCIMRAQPEVAKWSEQHPKWNVKRWTCRPAGAVVKI